MTVERIPSNYPRLSPYLSVADADEAIRFYTDILGFTQRGDVMRSPDGRVGHAELELDGSVLMLASEWPEGGIVAPTTVGGTAVTLQLYVDDVDTIYDIAIANGSTSLREPADQFYGDRVAMFLDPWGHRWSVSSHIEDVEPEEMVRRATAAMGG
jgi:PhnB protein